MTGNAHLFAYYMVIAASAGLNVAFMAITAVQRLSLTYRGTILLGIGITFSGRIKGHMKLRSVSGLKALCVRCYGNRIVDQASVSSQFTLGLCGVKLGTVH